MKLITGITVIPKQSMTLILENGTQAPFYMEYIDQNQGWYLSVSYPGWIGVTYMRMTVNGNLLRKWKNLIPFGLAILTRDLYEPIKIDDFARKRAKLYLLNQAEVLSFENFLMSRNSAPD